MPAGPRRALTVTEYVEMMDSQTARTQNLCADQPAQQVVRTALLRAEKEIHQGGWDRPPKVFFLEQNTRTNRIRYIEAEQFSRSLVELPGYPADVLNHLADVVEFMRRLVEVPAAGMDPAVHELPPTFRDMVFNARANPGADLFDAGGRTWRFHGVGMAFEAWMVLNTDDATVQLARDGELHTHPERMEIRDVYYAARDGWTWEVTRVRRTPTISIPRHCIVLNHDKDYRVTGGVPHALTRMCNAIASNPVPIVPDGWPAED